MSTVWAESFSQRPLRTDKHDERDGRDDGEDAQRAHAHTEHHVAELDDAAVQEVGRERDREQQQPGVNIRGRL